MGTTPNLDLEIRNLKQDKAEHKRQWVLCDDAKDTKAAERHYRAVKEINAKIQRLEKHRNEGS